MNQEILQLHMRFDYEHVIFTREYMRYIGTQKVYQQLHHC